MEINSTKALQDKNKTSEWMDLDSLDPIHWIGILHHTYYMTTLILIGWFLIT